MRRLRRTWSCSCPRCVRCGALSIPFAHRAIARLPSHALTLRSLALTAMLISASASAAQPLRPPILRLQLAPQPIQTAQQHPRPSKCAAQTTFWPGSRQRRRGILQPALRISNPVYLPFGEGEGCVHYTVHTPARHAHSASVAALRHGILLSILPRTGCRRGRECPDSPAPPRVPRSLSAPARAAAVTTETRAHARAPSGVQAVRIRPLALPSPAPPGPTQILIAVICLVRRVMRCSQATPRVAAYARNASGR